MPQLLSIDKQVMYAALYTVVFRWAEFATKLVHKARKDVQVPTTKLVHKAFSLCKVWAFEHLSRVRIECPVDSSVSYVATNVVMGVFFPLLFLL